MKTVSIHKPTVLTSMLTVCLGASACTTGSTPNLDDPETDAASDPVATASTQQAIANPIEMDMTIQTTNYPGLSYGLPSIYQLAVGDFNGDSRTDYAWLGSVDQFMYYSKPNGLPPDQSYFDYRATRPDLSFGAPSPWQLVTGDFDCDGVTDYARLGDNQAIVFYGNRPGPLVAPFEIVTKPYNFSSISLHFGLPSKWQVAQGDFDGDGCGDYIRLGDDQAWVFYGGPGRSVNFTPTFQPYGSATRFGLSGDWDVVTGDYDADGIDDYIRLGALKDFIFYGRRERDATPNGIPFASFEIGHENINYGFHSSWQALTGDFNGDGLDDYMRVGDTGAFVSFSTRTRRLFTNGFHDFSKAPLPLNFGFGQWKAIAGDFDGDHHVDYAMLGDADAFLFTNITGGPSFTAKHDTYLPNIDHFGFHSPWTSVVGRFRDATKPDSYQRLGSDHGFHFYLP